MVVAIKSKSTVGTARKYAILPDTRVLKNLGQTGEAGYKCLAELIDNSIDARNGQRATVNITYTTRRGRIDKITVEDDCSGMTEDQLVDAFKIGKAIKRDSTQIGRFGMGLKTAISALGTSWNIVTGTEQCTTAHSLTQDMETFVRDNKWEVEISSVDKNLPIEETRGTIINISGCDALNATLFERDLAHNLGDLFKHFINAGELTLTVNDQEIAATSIRVLTEGLTELYTEINGKAIRGWIGLRDIGTQNYGFSLVRHNRVIETNMKIGFYPHPAHNRIVGELHIDEFVTNHHKTSFNRNNDDWAALEGYITDQVKPLLALARDMANRDKKKINEKINAKLAEALRALLDQMKLNALFQDLTTGAGTQNNHVDGSTMPEKAPERGDKSDRTPDVKKEPPKGSGNGGINVRHDFVSDGTEAHRKRYEVIDGDLVVLTNVDHPMFLASESHYNLALQNCQEAISAYYAGEEARKTNQTVSNYATYDRVLDSILRIAIS